MGITSSVRIVELKIPETNAIARGDHDSDLWGIPIAIGNSPSTVARCQPRPDAVVGLTLC